MPSLSKALLQTAQKFLLAANPIYIRMRLEIVRCCCFSKTPVSGTAILLVLQRSCNEKDVPAPNRAMVFKLRRLRKGHQSRSSLKQHGHPENRWGDADVGSTNLYYRGSYSGAQRLCGSPIHCSVSASGDQCIADAAACHHVPTAADHAARACRGA